MPSRRLISNGRDIRLQIASCVFWRRFDYEKSANPDKCLFEDRLRYLRVFGSSETHVWVGRLRIILE